MNTCGSTLSNASSRNFIAYLAKSAAVEYGEVDWSSPKTFGMLATARLKQAARSLLISKRRNLLSDQAFLRKTNFLSIRQAASDLSWASAHNDAYSTAAEDCIAFELPIIHVWIIKRVMQAAALFPTQG